MTKVQIGEQSFEFGGDQLTELRDSSDYRNDITELRVRIETDGYLFIRDFHNSAFVADAREDVLSHLHDERLLDPESPVQTRKSIPTGRKTSSI